MSETALSTRVPSSVPSPATVLELLKPITWFPPMWAFACGVVSSGIPVGGRWGLVAAGVILVGPLVCATSQAINDWFDRHVDAINEPERPIPSGRMPGHWGIAIAGIWAALSAALSWMLGTFVFVATLLGLLLAWAYSAPPMRLKQNGWFGNAACGLCYEGLAWVTGAALLSQGGALPGARVFALAALYSIAAHGIMTLNDFKSCKGDARSGIRSLPVQLGVERAAFVACAFMLLPQVVVIALLLAWGHLPYALVIGALLLLQVVFMRRLRTSPARLAPWYNGTGVSALVLGMMVSAIAIR